MAKRKSKFNSLSTPGVRQDASNYLVELVFLRQNYGQRLPPKFWQQTKYKFRYRREIQACRKFIKKYGESVVLYIALHNPNISTWTDFGHIEFLLQQREEAKIRMAALKDNTPIEILSEKTDIDLRENKGPKKKGGLFERLKELNNE